jgi:CBS domain-containing protein
LATFARNWLEPLSPHLLDHGTFNPAYPQKGERPSLWPRAMRWNGMPRYGAGVTRQALVPRPDGDALHGPAAADVSRVSPKKNAMRVRHVMSHDVVCVAPDTSVQEIADLMLRNRISSVPVINRAGRLVGIVSDGDLIRRIEINTEPRPSWWRSLLNDARATAYEYVRAHGRTASDVMTPGPVTTTEFTPLHEVAALMAKRRLKQLPVVRGEQVVGTISRTDLVSKLARGAKSSAEPVSDEALRERIMERFQSMPWSMRIKALNAVVEDGVATVYGWVASEIERRALQVAVENTPGVRRVEDALHSVPPYV